MKLPIGVTLHRWTNRTGDEWACIAPDHGPMCRLCQLVTGTLAALLENVMDSRVEIVSMNPAGECQFRLTEAGERYVDQMMQGEHE